MECNGKAKIKDNIYLIYQDEQKMRYILLIRSRLPGEESVYFICHDKQQKNWRVML